MHITLQKRGQPALQKGSNFKLVASNRMELRMWPKVVRQTSSNISPWLNLIAREVEFAPSSSSEVYHAVQTADYVIVVAQTFDKKIPLVRQFRPAIERFTLEFPSGLRETREEPDATARRELLEETGYTASRVASLGVGASDSGRLTCSTYSFFIETGGQAPDFKPEPKVEMRLVTQAELLQLISDGDFDVQGHIGALMQAILHQHLRLL
jgi:ADP-ribose pyrophosphatase